MNVEMRNDVWSNRERKFEDTLGTAQKDMGHVRKGKGKPAKGSGEMAQWMKGLLCRADTLSSNHQHP